MSGGNVKLESLTKRFDEVTAVDDISVEIQAGEFFSLLGPSGCGKTTTLRMVAGFEPPTDGKILLDGVDVGNWPPNRRNVNTVFQSYALFPFLTVAENVAFGMKYKSVPKAELNDPGGGGAGAGPARPGTSSDAPTSSRAVSSSASRWPGRWCCALRSCCSTSRWGRWTPSSGARSRSSSGALQKQVGITFLYVTHDQEEALTMSDRLAVMNHGRIVQLGTPEEVYNEPADAYVADFLGVSNLMDAQVEPGGDGEGSCRLRHGRLHSRAPRPASSTPTGAVKLAIRPERIHLHPHETGGANRVPGMVERLVFLGSTTHVYVRLATGSALQTLVRNDGGALPYSQGTPVSIGLPADALRVLPDPGVSVAEIRDETTGEQAARPDQHERGLTSGSRRAPSDGS